MQYKGWTICNFGSYYLIGAPDDPDYYQFPLSLDEARALIDMPPLVREFHILVREMSQNSEFGHTLHNVFQMLESGQIPDDFFAYLTQDRRKEIIAAYLHSIGRQLAQEA